MENNIIDIGSRRNEFADEMWIDQDATEYRNNMKMNRRAEV